MMKRIQTSLLLLIVFALAACSKSEDPAKATLRYLEAKVAGDESVLRGLLCAEMEGNLAMEANTFAGLVATLHDVECETTETDKPAARVACSGAILVDYGTEEVDLPLSAYRMIQEDGEWKWCGETR